MANVKVINDLFRSMPQIGKIEWIGLRPDRREPLSIVESAEITVEAGLVGDRYSGKPSGKRMVTLIQFEHIQTVSALLGRPVAPNELRRNIVVSGINLLALRAPGRNFQFQIGEAILKATGNCHPCSRMEENLGPGGYNAMRGHGGITTSVVQGGTIRIGDAVRLLTE